MWFSGRIMLVLCMAVGIPFLVPFLTKQKKDPAIYRPDFILNMSVPLLVASRAATY